jgi:DNA-binding response OmpR family regulator
MERKKKILIADDDSAIIESVTLMLEDEGYRVYSSSDGRTAALIRKVHPDLVLLDVWMSGADGREICRELKRDEKTSGIPVIIFSANKDTEQIAKEYDANDFIAKPFQMSELLSKIAKNLRY